jgi:hypothetical protein
VSCFARRFGGTTPEGLDGFHIFFHIFFMISESVSFFLAVAAPESLYRHQIASLLRTGVAGFAAPRWMRWHGSSQAQAAQGVPFGIH